jgi:hypothetical protein
MGGTARSFLERFSNFYASSGGVQGGFFLEGKTLGILPSEYSNWRTALGRIVFRADRDSIGTLRAERENEREKRNLQ